MTRKEFIDVLDEKGYSYEIVRNKIIVTDRGDIYLDYLGDEEIPSGVVFKNGRNVYLGYLTSLPPGVGFENEGNVHLYALTSLPLGFVFKNGGNVYLDSLTSLPPGVEFNNVGVVKLDTLIGGWVPDWKGRIKGIASNRLLNLMISKGLFER
jgi:hypothetical protein